MNSIETPTCRVILCEHGRKWATVLRRQLAAPVCETRYDDAILAELQHSPLAVVVRETSLATMQSTLEFFDSASRQFSQAAFVAVGGRNIEPYEHVLMQAGVLFVCSSLRRTRPIARLVSRQLTT